MTMVPLAYCMIALGIGLALTGPWGPGASLILAGVILRGMAGDA